MFNRLSLVLLIVLIIIITIIYYQSLIKKRAYTSPIQSEEQSYLENPIYSEESVYSENLKYSEKPTYSEKPKYTNSSFFSLLSKLLNSTNNLFKKSPPLNQQQIDTNPLRRQYQPYLEYPLSNDKKLTNSSTCLLKEKDSCPLRSYKQCSNNYPLPNYNSFEICNCNVNNICPYKLEPAIEKPAIKIDCPLSHNQEKHTLILP